MNVKKYHPRFCVRSSTRSSFRGRVNICVICVYNRIRRPAVNTAATSLTRENRGAKARWLLSQTAVQLGISGSSLNEPTIHRRDERASAAGNVNAINYSDQRCIVASRGQGWSLRREGIDTSVRANSDIDEY